MKRTNLSVALMSLVIVALLLGIVGLLSGGLQPTGQAQESVPTPILQMPTSPPTPTVAPLPTDAAVTAGKTIFADSFATEASLANWQFIEVEEMIGPAHAVWKVVDGHLMQDKVDPDRNPSLTELLALTGDQSLSNYTVSAKFYDQSNVVFGLVARHSGNSYYRYRIIRDEMQDSPKQHIEKVVDGVVTTLLEINQPGHVPHTWYDASMTVSGSTIRVMLNGKVVGEVNDSSLSSGRPGLYTRALGGLLIDDVMVSGS